MPSASCCFLHVFGFTGKPILRSSKNTKKFPEKVLHREASGGHEKWPGGGPQPPHAPTTRPGGRVVGPRGAPGPPFHRHSTPIFFSRFKNPKCRGVFQFLPPHLSVPRRSNLEAFFGTLSEGEIITVAISINLKVTMIARE